MTALNEIERVIPSVERDSAIERLSRILRDFLPGRNLRVRVDIKRKVRSDLQNAALWGCAYKALTEQTGNDPGDLHIYFCGEHFGWKTVTVMDQQRRVPVRTTTRDEYGKRDVISTAHMAEFYDFIQRRSAMVGYDVPDPDPNWFVKDGEKEHE